MTTFKKQPQIESKDRYQQSTDWVMPWHQKGLRLQNILTKIPIQVPTFYH